jgi:hypothetical protein
MVDINFSRISLPGNPVNKLPVDVPEAHGWHHGRCQRPSRETLVGNEEEEEEEE